MQQVVASKGLDFSCPAIVVTPKNIGFAHNYTHGTKSIDKALWDSNKQDSISHSPEVNAGDRTPAPPPIIRKR